MWIKERRGDYRKCSSHHDRLNFLWKDDRRPIFVMDNHLAAAWYWLDTLDPGGKYDFMHIDQHSDLFPFSNPERFNSLIQNPKISLEEYLSSEEESTIDSNFPLKTFRWDNYILFMKGIFPDWFSSEIYACREFISSSKAAVDQVPKYTREYNLSDGESKQIGDHPYNADCYELPGNISYWIAQPGNKWIVNLDIDYFFMNGYQMFTPEYIDRIGQDMAKAMKNIEVLTIALSPECCGGWDNAIRAYNIIAKRLDLVVL